MVGASDKNAGVSPCAVHDGTVNSFGRDDVSFSESRECGFVLRTNAHFSDDKTVAKMGHPVFDALDC